MISFFFICWRIIALQCCFCCMVKRISYMYTDISSLLDLLTRLPPLSHTSRSSQSTSELPVLHSRFLLVISFTYGSAYVSILISHFFVTFTTNHVFHVYNYVITILIHLYYQRFYLLLQSWQVLYMWWGWSVCHVLHFLILLPWVGEQHYLVLSRKNGFLIQ